MKLHLSLLISLIFFCVGSMSFSMERQIEIEKTKGEPTDKFIQPHSLQEQALQSILQQLDKLIHENQFNQAIEKIKKLPDDLKYQLIFQLIKKDLRNKARYVWKKLSKESVLSQSNSLHEFLTTLQTQTSMDGLQTLMDFQIQNFDVIELIQQEEIIEKIVGNIIKIRNKSPSNPIAVNTNCMIAKWTQEVTSSAIKESLERLKANEISENEIPNQLEVATDVLASMPWNLVILLLETILEGGDKKIIWRDINHTIPTIYLFNKVSVLSTPVLLIELLGRLLVNEKITEEQKATVIHLMFKFENTLDIIPLLANYVDFPKLLELLLRYAPSQAKFDALYFIILSTIVQPNIDPEDLEDQIADIELLLQLGANHSIVNTQGKTLSQIVMQWANQQNHTIKLYDGKREIIVPINPESLAQIIELIKKYSKSEI